VKHAAVPYTLDLDDETIVERFTNDLREAGLDPEAIRATIDAVRARNASYSNPPPVPPPAPSPASTENCPACNSQRS